MLQNKSTIYTYQSVLPFTPDNPETLEELAEMILSDCSKQKYTRTIFMQRIPQVLEMSADLKRKELFKP